MVKILILSFLILISTRPTPALSWIWTNPENSSISPQKSPMMQGVVFEPPDGFYGGKIIRPYSKNEIRNMLGLVAANFSRISTYAVGDRAKITNLNLAKAISEHNLQPESPFLTLALAIDTDLLYHDDDNSFTNANNTTKFSQHIDTVLKSVLDANSLSPGSISALIFTWNFTKMRTKPAKFLPEIVANINQKIANQNIKIQIRTEDCSQFLQSIPQTEHKYFDTLICHHWPNIRTGGTNSAKQIAKHFNDLQNSMQNSDIELIGETGWPSIGSFQGLNGSRDESQRFWCGLQNLQNSTNFSIDVFTAFDGSWRSLVIPSSNPHFGVWLRVKAEGGRADDFAVKFSGCTIIANSPENTEIDTVTLVVAGVGGGVALILVLIGVGMYVKFWLFKDSFLSKADIEEFLVGVGTRGGEKIEGESAWNCPYDTNFEIAKTDLYIDTQTLLGKGAFGSVYLGKLEGFGSKVALKRADPTSKSSSGLKGMLSEIKILIHVGHNENVVSIIGAYTAEIKRGLVVIALELCELGSLDNYLRWSKEQMFSQIYSNCESRPQNAPILVQKGFTKAQEDAPTQNPELAKLLPKLWQWSNQICNGMEYIASRNVIHADLAARNVLLTKGEICKITDFGLSRRLYEYSNYVKQNQEPMPWRWMSIESLRHLSFSTKSDIWSFGVVLFEIWSLGNIPYGGASWHTDFVKELENGLRPSKPIYATQEMHELMKECWDIDPETRPDFTMLKSKIEAISGYDSIVPKPPKDSYIQRKSTTLGKLGVKIRNSIGIF